MFPSDQTIMSGFKMPCFVNVLFTRMKQNVLHSEVGLKTVTHENHSPIFCRSPGNIGMSLRMFCTVKGNGS